MSKKYRLLAKHAYCDRCGSKTKEPYMLMLKGVQFWLFCSKDEGKKCQDSFISENEHLLDALISNH
jgi:hypothetical protein